MTFGQPSGPPASARQVQELLGLLKEAGHADFRDARGPLGFTQRQAAGKFSRTEATEFIDRLQEVEFESGRPEVAPGPGPGPGDADADRALAALSSEELADELRRRGWTVRDPRPTRAATRASGR